MLANCTDMVYNICVASNIISLLEEVKMKKILAFILVLGVCCTIVFTATAVDPKQCSHKKYIVTSSTANCNRTHYYYADSCPLVPFDHIHYVPGKCTIQIWTCVTCGKTKESQFNFVPTGDVCSSLVH